MTTPSDKPRPRLLGPGVTFGICAALLVAFACLSYGAVAGWFNTAGKSATYDEPLHVLGGYLKRHHKDYRLNPEDPALFSWIVSLPNPKDALKVDLSVAQYNAIYDDIGHQWPVVWYTMYRSGNDEQRALQRSRAACTAIGVVLGALVAWWSYRLAGSVAAIAATTLYAFCPNFLAHASIVKNDVPLACVLLGLMLAVWLLGRRASVLRLVSVALLCGAALGIKYSGVLAGPIVAIALGVRALLPQPWEFLRLNLDTRLKRLAAAAATLRRVRRRCVRQRVGGLRLPLPPLAAARPLLQHELPPAAGGLQGAGRPIRARAAEDGGARPDADVREPAPANREGPAHPPTRAHRGRRAGAEPPRAAPAGVAHRLPLHLRDHARAQHVPQRRDPERRTRQFFPLAMLYKTPAATLVAIIAAAAVTVVLGFLKPARAPSPADAPPPRGLDAWAHVCLWLAPLLYGASALSTSLNLGLRHVLPVYPFIFIGVGVVVARVIARWRIVGFVAAELLALTLLIETLAAYPNFIPFFNVFAGGSRGGFELLGDSNLDWGQDLKELAEWQKQNPSRKLYLSYFGVADPAYYGVKAIHLPGGYIFASTPQQNPVPGEPAVIAVSATNLQGIYYDPASRAAYHQMTLHEPIAVLGGGSIYLYEYPFTARTLKDAPSSPP